MSRTRIRAVFLDAGDTLFTERRSRSQIYATVAREHGVAVAPQDMADAMRRIFHELPSSVDGSFRYSLAWFRAFNERVMAEVGVAESRRESAHEELIHRFQDPRTYKVFPEVIEVLEKLRETEVLVGIVSNWSEKLPELCDGLGISERVGFIVSSASMRAEKPDRAIFERALFRAGVPAEEAVHVGDHPERDVRGALEAGMRAVLLHRDPESRPSETDGVPVISDLRALLPLIEASRPAAASGP